MEEKDIVPQLLEQLQGLFKTAKGKDKRIEALLEKALAGEAAYPDADEFAARVGEALAAAFREGLSDDTLPEGRLWWNIADRAVRPLLEEGYKEGADFAGAVQESLNKKANIGLKVQTSPADRDRIDGILNMAAAAERYDLKAAELEDAAVNLVQHAVTDTLRRNVESHARAGLSPRIIRRAEGRACKWCRSLAGTYAYPDVPEDVYRRHENCRCTVEYDPRTGKTQNVHTKEWNFETEHDKMISRKQLGLTSLAKKLADHPKRLASFTPAALKAKLEADGFEIKPLRRGSLKDLAFEEGGGYKVNFEDGGLLQYHPAARSHHNGAYYKISTGKGGTHRYDLEGNEIDG